MQVLSKLNKPCKILKWNEYFDNNVQLKKYKIPQLKEIAKDNKLKISGTKPVLIERITIHFNKIKNIVKIQSIFRMYLVKMTTKMRGIALKDTSICVNICDFYTLEPLKNISYFDFFSYTDSNNFTYGFDINSLMILFKKPGNVKNPYDRNKIPFDVIKNVSIISKLTKYFFNKLHNIKYIYNEPITQRENILEKMRTIRNKDTNNRIEELFYEIDNLGNYSSSSWFKNLSCDNYFHLLKYIYEIWSYRANIPTTTKRKICPYFNPFQDGLENVNLRDCHVNENTELMQRCCLVVMENMIYTGINNEYKQIAAMHILSALTLVSDGARGSLPWLYESVDI